LQCFDFSQVMAVGWAIAAEPIQATSRLRHGQQRHADEM
jgi:hypothetical protein